MDLSLLQRTVTRRRVGGRALVNPFIYLFMCHGSWKPDGRGDQRVAGRLIATHRAGIPPGPPDGGDRKSHGERVDIARVVGLMPIPEEVNSREANVG